jgi:hypothetical protein
MMYKFEIIDFKVVAIYHNDNCILATANKLLVATIQDAKQFLPICGVNIDKIIEFETTNNLN